MGGEGLSSMIKSPKDAYMSLAEKGAITAAESSIKVFGQSFMAGCYIGFGALLAVIIAGAMPEATANNPGLKSLVFAFLFPVNLFIILLTGGILFTGTAAACPAAVYEKKASVADAARCLALSWVGNMLGSICFALFTVECELNEGSTHEFLIEIALKKTSHSFDVTFARGIGCNWMSAWPCCCKARRKICAARW
jgi:formate transporter